MLNWFNENNFIKFMGVAIVVVIIVVTIYVAHGSYGDDLCLERGYRFSRTTVTFDVYCYNNYSTYKLEKIK
jgi:hypothetical protein